jgi:RNA polymerase sigma factor (sigma-70 family)
MTSRAPDPPDLQGHDSDPESGVHVCDPFDLLLRKQAARTIKDLEKIGISRPDAEDLFQEAFLKTWARREDFSPDEWPCKLRRAVKNETKMAMRAFATAEAHEPEVAYETLLDTWAANLPPETLLGAKQVNAALLAAVEALEPKRRAVAQLHVLEEMELKETAAALAAPFETVKKRWRLARAELHATLLRTRAGERFTSGGFESYAFLLWLWKRCGVPLRRFAAPARMLAAAALLVTFDAPMLGVASLGEQSPAIASVSTAMGAFSIAWAEREREPASGAATPSAELRAPSPPATIAAPAAPHTSPEQPPKAAERAQPSQPPAWSTAGAQARTLLQKAQDALGRGALNEAAAVLRRYEREHPDNPYHEHYRDLRVDLVLAARHR